MMTAQELVRKCVDIAKNYSTLYVSGCFGAPMVGKNVDRYCVNNNYNRGRQSMIRAAADKTPPVYGFDCVCLIKGILWGWNGKPSGYGGAVYASGNVPDIGEDEMIRRCRSVTDDFREIVPGAVVWMPGHIGVYIGSGLAVECSPKWANGVQITAVGNIGSKIGYNTRIWKKWGLLPYVNYKEEEAMTYEQWKEYMDRYEKERAEFPAPAWAVNTGEWERAKDEGVISDLSRPQSHATRAEVAAMVLRAKK